MPFEWDEAKNRSNIHKHGISFEQAIQIFDGPVVSWADDRRDYGEARTISVGMMMTIAILTVVHTDRRGAMRIISARTASRAERRLYEKALQQTDDA